MLKQDNRRRHFLRHCLTVTGVFESLCCDCGNRIAYSPDMRALQIAEESHICPASSKAAPPRPAASR